MKKKFDFAGWVTRNDLLCSDGRIIKHNAFKDNDGETVPLVWNHDHNTPDNVLGHVLLENRDDGVYGYASFNETPAGKNAKLVVQHGDVVSLSIWANQLNQNGRNVVHGAIREVSLVLAGANPGAKIESVIRHGVEFDDEAIISTGMPIELAHADNDEEEKKPEPKKEDQKMAKEETNENESGGKEKTAKEVFDTLTEEQKTVVYALVGQAIEDAKGGSDEDDEEDEEETPQMKHNLFDNENDNENILSHSEMVEIVTDAKRIGSMKEAFLQHGINQIDYLFPDAKNVGPREPIFVQRNMEWVSSVMGGVKHSAFSRIKSIFADITGDEARARGYIKGEYKEEEVFALLKRTTTPKTIYKKQSFDRDDVIDITDIDVIAWVKKEMRMMLDEEIARAILIGDGRSSISPDKIDEDKVRPIYKDDNFFSVKYPIVVAANATDAAKAKAFIRASIKSRKEYKGSGNPVMFTTEDMLTECLLLEDLNQRIIYDTEEKLKTALRVSKIVTVPVMEGLTRTEGGKTYECAGIYVNLDDYNVGADKGGEVNLFDDFDIDYNKQKYLIETRISGALVKPFSAVVLEFCEGEPLTLGVAPMNKEETVLGKSVKELQSGVTVFQDEIAGRLNYVTGYTGFDDEDTDNQEGNFLALKFATPTGSTTTVEILGSENDPVTLDSTKVWVGKIDNNSQKIQVVVSKSGETLTKVFTMHGLMLRGA